MGAVFSDLAAAVGGYGWSIFRFCGCGKGGAGVCVEYFQILRLRKGGGMGGVSSDFLAAGRGQVVGDYFQILWLREGGVWVEYFQILRLWEGWGVNPHQALVISISERCTSSFHFHGLLGEHTGALKDFYGAFKTTRCWGGGGKGGQQRTWEMITGKTMWCHASHGTIYALTRAPKGC